MFSRADIMAWMQKNHPHRVNPLDIETPPPASLPIEELIEQRKQRFERKRAHEEAGRLIPVHVRDANTIGILHFGDPHCLTTEHEILTKRGWLTHDEIVESDLVAGVDATGSFTWQGISRIIRREINGGIYVCDTKGISLACTDRHRVLAAKARSGGYNDIDYHLALTITNSQYKIPVTAWAGQGEDLDYTDDELRLLAWILTDAHWERDARAICIYQCKPHTVREIERVLTATGTPATRYYRERTGTHELNGRTVKYNYGEHTFRLGLGATEELCRRFGMSNREVPEFLWRVSSRQFRVFLDAVVSADGEYPSTNCMRIYKDYRFLDHIQALCCKHGLQASLRAAGENYGCLTVIDRRHVTIKPRYNMTTSRYKGLVWCVTVDQGNFFTRRNGKVHLTGNCDDDGTDIGLLEKHINIVKQTPGLFAANIGDTTNNWIGRLARLYGDQSTTAAEAWQLAEWFINSLAGRWLYLIAGNHDCWAGAGDPLAWITRQAHGLYRSSETRLNLIFPNGSTVRINARHDHAGHSQYNPAHGPAKASIFGFRDHIAICGHKHVSGYNVLKDSDSRITMHAIQIGSYKIYDTFAKTKGFREQSLGPCALTVIDYSLDGTHPDKIKVFWDAFEGAEFLTWKRGRK
jgi:hypothetical protein